MASTKITVKVQCNIKGCYKVFEGTAADEGRAAEKANNRLRTHKAREDDHEYCKRCDLDFECWDDLVRHKAESEDSIHMSCKWCGMDFGSQSGREKHIRQHHPKDQDIKCDGCGERFTRAAAFTFHLEKDLCRKITSQDFANHVRHKELISSGLNGSDLRSSFNDAAEDTEAGGILVKLDDEPDAAGPKRHYQTGPNVVHERFPALSLTRPSKTADMASYDHNARLSKLSLDDPDERRLAEVEPDAHVNTMTDISWANPDLPGFDIERFHHPVNERYTCPWESCKESIEDSAAFRDHIRNNHGTVKLECPGCFKRFKATHGLVAHLEAADSRCRFADNDKFGEFMSLLTGGFVDARVKVRDDVHFTKKVEHWDGSMRTKQFGMSYVEYKSARPLGKENEKPRKLTQVTGPLLAQIPHH